MTLRSMTDMNRVVNSAGDLSREDVVSPAYSSLWSDTDSDFSGSTALRRA